MTLSTISLYLTSLLGTFSSFFFFLPVLKEQPSLPEGKLLKKRQELFSQILIRCYKLGLNLFINLVNWAKVCVVEVLQCPLGGYNLWALDG